MIPKTKRETLQALDRKLWRIFSEYVRLRDSEGGYVSCISCGKFVLWRESDAGHFVNRAKKSVKFNEKNVNAQCRHCNRFREGEQYLMAKRIDLKYGEGTADTLSALGTQKTKLTRDWYEEMIKTYKGKVKSMKELKG